MGHTTTTFRSAAALLALTVSLAACVATSSGDDDEQTGDGAEGAAADAGDGDADGGGTDGGDGGERTLTVWTYYVSGGQLDALEAQSQAFEEANEGVTVEHVQIPFDQLAPRLLAGVTTQDGPDVVLDNVVVDFPSLAASGALLDLTDLWNGFADADLFPESAVWADPDGAIYNVMSYTNLLGLYHNADALEELGIDPPTDIDEFEAALTAVAEDGTYRPLSMSGVASPEGAWMFMPLLLGQGVDYCSLDEATLAEAFERVSRWTEDGYLPREASTWDQADAWQAFASGDYAFGINGNWNLGDLEGSPFTVGTGRYPVTGDTGSVVFPGGEAIGIGAFTDDADLAWQYIEDAWLSAESSLTNFELTGQIPTRSDLADAPEVAANELVTPFVEAAAETGSWPGNENTAAMQNAVGQALSSVISGGTSPADAASQTLTEVEGLVESGGGAC